MSLKNENKRRRRQKIRQRIRKNLSGTAARPRLAVFKSNKYIYAQVIDDESGHTLLSASSFEAAGRDDEKRGGNIAAAKVVGATVATRAKEKGIQSVVFDRGGYLYHGRVRALAEGAREAGLEF